MIFRLSKGVTDALPALAAELVRIPVDVIVTDSTSATLAAFNAERRELHRNVAQHVVGNEFIPASVRHDIIERTDGIPQFVEEMTKAVLEAEMEGRGQQAAARVPPQAVPASLHASLMARLKPFGEPAVDRSEQVADLIALRRGGLPGVPAIGST